MGSSGGGGDDSMAMMALMGQGKPMPGLPIAGQGPGLDAFKYGQFQNFLPDPVEEGQNPMATGLRPDMFKYRSPGGIAAEDPDAGGSNDLAGEIQGLREELAKLTAGQGGGNTFEGMVDGNSNPISRNVGGIGTMGLGRGGFGPAANGVAPPANGTQLPTPNGGWARGNVPGWPMGGPGTPKAMPAVNSSPEAFAAALAANRASGPVGPGFGTAGPSAPTELIPGTSIPKPTGI